MADSFSEDIEDPPANAGDDVEMVEEAEDASANGAEPSVSGEVAEEAVPPRTTFAQYLTSPVVTLIVGGGHTETILTAHQSLLLKSPFFAEACAEFADDGSVSHARQLCDPSPAPSQGRRERANPSSPHLAPSDRPQ